MKKPEILVAIGSVIAVAASATLPMAASAATNITGTVTLTDDADWTAEGPLVIESGATLDLAGHTLRIAGLGGEGTLTSSTTATFENLTTDPTKATCSDGIASVDSGATAACVFNNTARTIVQKTKNGTTYWPFSATYDFETPTVVNSYKITTGANDFYNVRAPGQWEVLGSNDKSEWASLGKAVRSETEWEKTGKQGTAGFELSNYTAYRYYKITITVSANQDAEQGGYIEFRQLQFGYTSHGCAIVADSAADISGLTVSGDTKIALSGTISLAKDCDLRSLGSALDIARDTQIDLGGHKLYANAAAFTAACTVKDAEISHDDDLTSPGGTVSSSPATLFSNTKAANLFNNNYARAGTEKTKRIIVETEKLPLAVTYDFGEDNAQVVDAYRIWTGSMLVDGISFAHRLPMAWKFEGSNDNNGWTPLDKRGAECAWPDKNTRRTYTFDNSVPYRYYRITIDSPQPDNDGYLELVQLEFFRLAPARGELHVETTSGQIVSLDKMSLAGNLRFFVEGAGTVYLSTTNQTYVGGTEICGGTVGGGVGLTSLVDMDIFGEQGSEVVVRGDGTKAASAQNAILGFLNRYGYTGYKYVLAGGVLQSPGNGIVSELRLAANSRMAAAENLVEGGSAWFGSTNANKTAYADFGGYTCNINVASGRRFALSNATFENGVLWAETGGWFATTNNIVATNNFKLAVSIAQDIGNNMAVKDYTLRNNNANFNNGSGVVDVYGTFMPQYGKYFHGARLMDGAIVDFADMDASASLPIPTVAAFNAATTGAKTLLFDSGATIGVKLGSRKVPAGTRLISWDAATKPESGVKFKRADADRRYSLVVKDDGLYYVGPGLIISFH